MLVPSTDVIDAMSGLNSWIRSDSFQLWDNRLIRDSLYNYKKAILSALMNDHALKQVRKVYVEATCRDCGGKGRYINPDCGAYDHCWHCGNSGTVHLEFIETTLPNGHIWHTPDEVEKCPYALRGAVFEIEAILSDWDVNRAGKEMTTLNVTENLNCVEDWYAAACRWPKHLAMWWYDVRPPYYKLPLGIRPKACAFCESVLPDDAMGFFATTQLFQWKDWCCEACEKRFDFEWPPFSVPEELISQPVRDWLKKRVGWREKRTKTEP